MPAYTLIELTSAAAKKAGQLRARIKSLRIVSASERIVELTSDREIQINLAYDQTLSFRASAPPGTYRELQLQLAYVELSGAKPIGQTNLKFPLDFALSDETPARLKLTLDANLLIAGQSLKRALTASVTQPVRHAEGRTKAGSAMTLRWQVDELTIEPERLSSVRIPADSFPDGTLVTIRETPASNLPPLFRRQQRVGPVLSVEARTRPLRPVEITVTFDETLMARAGARASELIVMRLNSARDHYFELRPVRIDLRNRTLTVRTSSMSEFFACTPGVLIEIPEIIATPWELAAVVTGNATTIAGRITDEQSTVRLINPPAAASWMQFGRFEFQNIPLAGASTLVEIEARVPGQPPHACHFVLKREPPPKRVDLTNRLYLPAMSVSADDDVVISSVLNHSRITDVSLVEPIDDWQSGYVRPEPFIYVPGRGGSFWHRIALLPETFFENEVARLVVEANGIAVNPAAPEAIRYLVSLANEVAISGDAARESLEAAWVTAAREFRDERLMLSSIAPVLVGDGGQFATAFVAATLTARRRAEASGMQSLISRYNTHPRGDWNERPVVYAGTLFYLEGREGALQRERVADDIWCATIAMRRDPQSGQPVIAALALIEEAADAPRVALRLYRRADDRVWVEETVVDDRPIVDFDFAFGSDGTARFVAVTPSMPSTADDRKWHMLMIQSRNGTWLAEPLVYHLRGLGGGYDLGARPRIHVEGSGRNVVVFVFDNILLLWVVAVEEMPQWRAEKIQHAEHLDVTGSPLPPIEGSGVRIDLPVFTSGLSLVLWGPSIIPDGEGRLWCSFGSGMLNLARVDLGTLNSESYRIDVDRLIGFAPSIAVRQNGAPAVVYKDPFGFGQFGPGDQDEVHFLSLDFGNVTPLNETFSPVLPPFERGSIGMLRDFRPLEQRFLPADPSLEAAEYVPLDCEIVFNAERLNPLLFSLLSHRTFHMEIYPAGGDYPRERLNYVLSHPDLAGMLESLAAGVPTIAVFIIDNSGSPGEAIERVDITQFNDPIGTLDQAFAADLDQENVTDEIRMAFRNQGLAMSDEAVIVTRLNAGNAWNIRDTGAFQTGGAEIRLIPQIYLVRRRRNELQIRIPPVVSVVDRADRRGEDGRREPCGLRQNDWDAATRELALRFTGLQIDLPDDIPGQLRRVEISDMRMTSFEAWDPSNDQQGGIRFTFSIPRVMFRNSNPNASGWATDPSYLRVTLAPCLSDGRILWWTREVDVTVSRFDVDIDVGVFSWLKWFAVIPGLGFLFLVADPFLDRWARSKVNEGFEEPGTGGFEDALLEAVQGWFDRRTGGNARGLEGAYMRDLVIRTWTRERLPAAPGSDLKILPAGVSFGQNEAGGPIARRNVLLVNDGNSPALVEDVVLTLGAPVMEIESLRNWPVAILPGDSLVIRLTFMPQGNPGFRDGELQIRSNGGRVQNVPLLAQVLAPRMLRIRPRLIQFGIINAGQTSDREVEAFNDGPGLISIDLVRIVGAQANSFEVRNDPTGVILQGQSVRIRIRFRPSAGSDGRHEARVILETTGETLPETEIPVTGYSVVLSRP